MDYKTVIKENKIPKEKVSVDVPKKAILVTEKELPEGIDSRTSNTDGLGYELFADCKAKGKYSVCQMKCAKKVHGKWFIWDKKK